MIELVKILKHKETGKLHCPFCHKECNLVKIVEGQKCLYCKKCKKYYGNPEEKNRFNLTKRGKKLEKANDEFYKTLKKLNKSEAKEFLILIMKSYFIGFMEMELNKK